MRKFLFGALVGAGIALLYAPATGRRTRSLIRDKANKLANDTNDFVQSKQRHLSNKMEGYRAKVRSVAERMGTRVGSTSGVPYGSDAVSGQPEI